MSCITNDFSVNLFDIILFDEFIVEFIWLVICIYALRKTADLLGTVVLQYDYGAMFSLFQGSLTHCEHIISHVWCIPETRDIVVSWLLGSLFVTTKFYQRNWVQDLYCEEKCKNTVWKMSINNSDCMICELQLTCKAQMVRTILWKEKIALNTWVWCWTKQSLSEVPYRIRLFTNVSKPWNNFQIKILPNTFSTKTNIL